MAGRSHGGGGSRSSGGGSRSSGGGRSHFSSGGSRSSFSSGSRSSFSSSRSHMSSHSSHSHHIGGPRPIHHGHYHHHIGGPHIHTSIHVSGPVGVIIGVILAFLAFYCLPLFISFSNVNASLDEITTSYYYYQDMIEYAKQHPSYQMKGKVIGIYQDYNYDDAWYLKYTIYHPNHKNQTIATEYTFSVYTEDDISNIKLGDEIMIAVDSPLPPIYDSIDMNYGNVSLNEDPEYQYYHQRKSNLTKVFTIYGIIAGSIVAITLTFAIKAAIKKSKAEGDNSTLTTATTPTVEKPRTSYCAYCGVALESGASKCKVCGARNDK